MADAFHYPPELMALLVDTIPLLCRSKSDVVVFFHGAGIPEALLSDVRALLARDRSAITKYEIARSILVSMNAGGDKYLRERREVVRRIVEYEDFSSCWPNDQLKARGAVAGVRNIVNVKDSFTRM